ncbi:helix-turn-helix domain-containing protein [bacterium]|nr:helix-turn-helix domain-containing protein [bacterium]
MNNLKNDMEHSEIIKKIKKLRLERGYSLGMLSKLTGLSKGYLSKIENIISSPPISTLQRISTALGVNFSYFFVQDTNEISERHCVISRKEQRAEGHVEVQASGLKRWPMADLKFGRNMDPYIIEISSDHYQVYQYEGEEFYLCMEGKVELTSGSETHIIDAGDSVYIDTNTPYSFRSLSKTPAKMMMIVYDYKRERRGKFVGRLPYKKLYKNKPKS